MVAYKVRKGDGTWYTLGSGTGATAKIRRLDGTWAPDDGTGLLAKVRKLDGTMGTGVPFGAGGWSPTVYFTDPAYKTTGVLANFGQCRLVGPPGVAPTTESHVTTTNAPPVKLTRYEEGSGGVDFRQDAIVWLNPGPSVFGLTQPTPPSGYVVEHIDGTATRVRVTEYDASVRGLNWAGSTVGWMVMIHAADDPRAIGGAYTSPATNVSPTTQHASNGPTGAQLALAAPNSTRADVSVTPNSSGDIGLHMALTWSVSDTTWALEFSPSQTLGLDYPVYEEGFTYVKAYMLARHNPAGAVTTSDFVTAGSAGSQPSAWQDSSTSTYYYFESDNDPAAVARFTINREANMTATDFEHIGFALQHLGNGSTVWLENGGVQIGDAVTVDESVGAWNLAYDLFGGWDSSVASAAWSAYSSVSIGAATPLKIAVRNDSSGLMYVSYLALRAPLGS